MREIFSQVHFMLDSVDGPAVVWQQFQMLLFFDEIPDGKQFSPQKVCIDFNNRLQIRQTISLLSKLLEMDESHGQNGQLMYYNKNKELVIL